MDFDTAFQVSTSNLRFGAGTTREVGLDLQDLGLRRTLLVIDPRLRDLPAGQTAVESLRAARIDFDTFDGVSVEPTDATFRTAIAAATEGKFDSFVAVGGGSTIDTAKAANLYSTYPADFFDYVNAPIGRGLPVVRGTPKGMSLFRQVLLTAGLINLAAGALALGIDVRWAWVPVLTGCGMILSGATGFCGMALLLAKMPWNRP